MPPTAAPARPLAIRTAMLLLPLVALAACGKSETQPKGGPGSRVPQVGFVTVQPSDVPNVIELAARTSAYEVSEVRPQVSGVIRRRYFTEGSLVRRGQTLYQIDPDPYRAAAAQATANLESARANAEAARTRAERYRPLAQIEAVSQQDYTDAEAQARQARASVSQNQAAVEAAQINLRFTNVPAPITGRIGRSFATVGALVTANQTDSLATISRLDPIFVDIQQSSTDLLRLRRALAKNGVVPNTAPVRLKLEDGSDYGVAGRVEFAETTVDPNTGTVTLRARFPNPQNLLLPGMFVRAQFAQAIDRNAFLVPQAAVARDPTGGASVLVVGPGNKAVQKKVQAPRTQGNMWVVTGGLAAGDRVIVQGTGNAKPGQPVRPVPANTPQRLTAPRGGGTEGGASGPASKAVGAPGQGGTNAGGNPSKG